MQEVRTIKGGGSCRVQQLLPEPKHSELMLDTVGMSVSVLSPLTPNKCRDLESLPVSCNVSHRNCKTAQYCDVNSY
jgi:hypothetical protein